MKKLLLASALVAAATAAHAATVIVPAGTTAYVAPGTTAYVTPAPQAYYVTYSTPQPVYYTAYDYTNDRNHDYDWRYWNHQDRYTRDDHHDWNDSDSDY